MIDPQVVHGGASSWFWIAACANAEPEGSALRALGVAGADAEPEGSALRALGASIFPAGRT